MAKYVYGPETDEAVRMATGGADYYYHAAALGIVTEITDSANALVEQYSYDVYGQPSFRDGSGNPLSDSEIGNRLLFQGRDRDPDTELYNFRNRYYSPALGRFLQVDPIRHLGGLNLYGFVQNQPTGFIDPAGLISTSCQDAIWKRDEIQRQLDAYDDIGIIPPVYLATSLLMAEAKVARLCNDDDPDPPGPPMFPKLCPELKPSPYRCPPGFPAPHLGPNDMHSRVNSPSCYTVSPLTPAQQQALALAIMLPIIVFAVGVAVTQ
jgi:RHS repeat-associated protein